MNKNNIDIQIESLILQGFDPRHREQISASIRAELERLIREGGVPNQWPGGGRKAPQVIPTISVAADQSPRRIGESVARTIYRGVK